MACIDFNELIPGFTVTVRRPFYFDAVEFNMALGEKSRDVAYKDLRRLGNEKFETKWSR